MAISEQIQEYSVNGNGFSTLQRFSNRHQASPNQLYEAINVKLQDRAGTAMVSNGYVAQGTTLGGNILGLYGHMSNSDIGYPVAVSGTTIYYWNGSAWTASGTTALTAGLKAEFASFLNRVFMVNGAQALSSTDSITWDTTQLASVPAGVKYIERYAVRLFVADATKVYWSTLPDTALNITWPSAYNVVIETDDGDIITGIKRYRTRLLVFKNFSIHRLILSSDLNADVSVISDGIGSSSQRSVITYKDVCYFFGTGQNGESGIYATNGEQISLISRPIQDLVDAIPQAQWSSICAGLNNGVVKWYIGDITLDLNGVNEKTITKCELQYSVDDDSWQVRSLLNVPAIYAPIKLGSTRNCYFGGSMGIIMKDEFGTTYNGTAINATMKTHIFIPAGIKSNVNAREVWITGTNLQDVIVQIRTLAHPSQWISLTNSLKDRTDLFKSSFRVLGSQFQLQIFTKSASPQIEKIDMNFVKGLQDIV